MSQSAGQSRNQSRNQSRKGPLPLPVEASMVDGWSYSLCTSGWHRLIYLGLAVGAGLALLLASYLLGAWASPHQRIANLDNALQATQWPEQTAAVAAGFNSEDDDATTLTVRELRYLLEVIDTNAMKVASGLEPEAITAARPTDEVLAAENTSETVLAYWEWVDDNACSLSGWSGEAHGQVATLVRNGVWQCSGFRQWLSGLPVVLWLGTWLGLLATLALLVAPWPLLHIGWRKARHIGRIHRMNTQIHGSWMR